MGVVPEAVAVCLEKPVNLEALLSVFYWNVICSCSEPTLLDNTLYSGSGGLGGNGGSGGSGG